MVRETAGLAKDLGAKIVRLFAAWPGVPIHEGVGTYELCHPVLNEDHTRGDIKYVDNHVKLAREFLARLIG